MRSLPLLLILVAAPAGATRLKELVDVDGFRGNHLIGLGLVMGLAGTGDDSTSVMTRHPMAAMLRHLGSVVNEADLKSRNVAVVMVTGELPPFARAGMGLDVLVSSAGNAKSLAGGTLIVTALRGVDGQTYALAQGALAVGGFAAEGGGGSQKKGHVTVGRIPGGAVIERDGPATLPEGELTLLLREPDFTTAWRIVQSINDEIGDGMARVADPGAVRVSPGAAWKGRTVELVARLEAVEAIPDAPARVVIDERTGTIAVGAAVTLGATAIAHAGITIKVEQKPVISQPAPLSKGQTVVAAGGNLEVEEAAGKLAVLTPATTVGDVAAALNALGVKPRDLVAIFQALRTTGALRAELVVQ